MLEPGTITIGRTKDNAVFCLHKSLSRKHAELEFDGTKVRIRDLQSKNGVFVRGRRVDRCELVEGDSFRCGDITFVLEGATVRTPASTQDDRAAQTLPSPFALGPAALRRKAARQPQVLVDESQRYKDKLFLLIRASELCVSQLQIDTLLEELVLLAVQVLEVDRIVLLTLDDATLEMRPRVVKTFVTTSAMPWSKRVVDWVVDHGEPASFPDVSGDRTLPGDRGADAAVRAAMCVPIDPGSGTIGVIYADSLSRTDCFRPDDVALLRALANLAAVVIEGAAFREAGSERIPRPARPRAR